MPRRQKNFHPSLPAPAKAVSHARVLPERSAAACFPAVGAGTKKAPSRKRTRPRIFGYSLYHLLPHTFPQPFPAGKLHCCETPFCAFIKAFARFHERLFAPLQTSFRTLVNAFHAFANALSRTSLRTFANALLQLRKSLRRSVGMICLPVTEECRPRLPGQSCYPWRSFSSFCPHASCPSFGPDCSEVISLSPYRHRPPTHAGSLLLS